ncbi:2-octaprenyl-6-methoxyphenol hydroxylase [Acaryochloris thomasi RCC1774]|uniref:2-octaprenyl-6-methoxyphenol hydroxylase n=1 Tax=Acaryochloris thomasi RCC1774 TaxID=1764569 RepID=A0A2W1JX17_9CYAN|nr:FAD-dependent hydroxylase [Acaryochloris thomasi]PZD74174.1 2-octaprenyl-6-methoxyphenol hydroxylase [Acaryochloris thomasi RCC1774]
MSQDVACSAKPAVFDYDIAIVGGGVVGATLAASLKHSGLAIAIIEAQSQSDAIAKGQAYAIHQSSRQVFDDIGVWPQIESQIEFFRQVRLSDADSPHVVEFESSELQAKAIGYVAKHRILLQELQSFLTTCEQVDWHCPAQVTTTDYDAKGATLQLASGESLRVRMVVAADGAKSQVRQQAGIKTHGWPYWQSCVVATIAPEKHHDNIAYEKFWPSGPFAILPSAKDECRVVWTAPHKEAQALLDLNDDQFIDQLHHRYGNQMGQLSLVGKRHLFPAKWMHANRYVQPRLALVGDAAHSCHPVGGQGLNLGIRDAATLAQVLTVAHQHGEDIGSLMVLRRYQSWRRQQNLLSLGFTDILNRTFSNQWFPLVQVRRLGLQVMQRIPPLKVWSLKFMAGLHGRSATST